jgi:serine phosphatase RsbU (regulator of sigma subunit)
MASGSTGGRVEPASLVVLDPAGSRTRVRLQPLPFRIGRQSDNHLVLRDSRISRSHARIEFDDGAYHIEDLDSRHGLFVNGARVIRQRLENSDRIEFGFADSYRLLFALEDADIHRLLDQFAAPAMTATAGSLGKLRALVEVARALETSLSTEDVLTALVDAALAVTGAERGFLLLRREDQLDVRAARDRNGRPLDAGELRVPSSVIHRALTNRRELLSMSFDPAAESDQGAGRTVAELELRSVVCVPLVKVRSGGGMETAVLSASENTVGLLYMDSRLGAADLSSGNREILQTLALEASTILENARLIELERARQRMEEELKIARGIQESLQPRQLPSSGWFRAAGRSIPSHQVGGDYFEVGEISPLCWSVVAADVSGKGVSSALLASLLQGMFLAGADSPSQMEQMMARVNRFLIERTGGEKYATLFYCTLEHGGLLRWVNAGHCPPLLVRAGEKPQVLPASALPVGMLEEATFQARETRLQPGDKLVIYTDGLSEAQNADGEFFGEKRIRETLAANAASDCAGLFQALDQAVLRFTSGAVQRDDITLVVVEYRPEP